MDKTKKTKIWPVKFQFQLVKDIVLGVYIQNHIESCKKVILTFPFWDARTSSLIEHTLWMEISRGYSDKWLVGNNIFRLSQTSRFYLHKLRSAKILFLLEASRLHISWYIGSFSILNTNGMNHSIRQNKDGITVSTPNKLFACPLVFQ